MTDPPHSRRYDFLVVGAGLAGLSCALRLARLGRVAVLAKRDLFDSNTQWAQGGIAAVWNPGDSFEAHIADTLAAGADLNRRDAVEVCVREGPDRIRELIDLGVRFTRDEGGGDGFHLTREGGHSERRVLHADDVTGAELQRVLVEAAGRDPRIEVFTGHLAVDLITERKVARYREKRRLAIRGREAEALFGPGGPEAWPAARQDRCLGAYALDARTGRVTAFEASVTVLATGGAGKVYLYTTNPDVASGDGMAMAYRAGATLANMEFVQFHPTCLYHPDARNFLISEAVRGEGGVLRLPDGEAFMSRHDPRGDLAPRDVVARAIDHEIKARGLEFVHLDVTHVPAEEVVRRFPNIHARCLELGIDMTRQPLPVVPAAHYFCGGVLTDLHGRTDLGQLYAVGEVACSGLHGANRLASNSLLEAAVFAARASVDAGRALDEARRSPGVDVPPWDEGDAVPSDEEVVVLHNWDEIRRLMWNYVGIVRTDRRLARARRRIEMLEEEIEEYYWSFRLTSDLVELRNLATVASLAIRCAQARRESRGLHYNLDCPATDDECWKRDTLLRREW
ncbi:L-aspartate oxidase [Myxococcota bacterium]|nr:L-aspartate oxidase [Myxococcota bacterium]